MELNELVKELKEARARKAEVEETLKAVKADVEEAERAVIDKMIDTETSAIRVDGTLFSLKTTEHYSCPSELAEELFTLLRRDGLGAIIKEKVDPRTLSAALREMAEDGELPDDYGSIVKVYEKQSISVRKGA